MTLEQMNEVKAIAEMAVASKQGYFYLWMVVLFGLSGAGGYFAAYLKMKGENKATREDIGEITEKVKAVESKFDEKTARLSSNLELKGHFNKFRFEKEAAIYEELWPRMEKVKSALQYLSSVENTFKKITEQAATLNKQKRLNDLLDASNKLDEVLDKYRPFFPPSVWVSVSEFKYTTGRILEDRDKIFCMYDNLNEEQIIEKFQEHVRSIEVEISKVASAIRQRLTEFDSVN